MAEGQPPSRAAGVGGASFAYDDDNGQSSDFNSTDAQYVQVAIGW